MLAANPQSLAAGYQHFELRAVLKQVGQGRRRNRHLLEVVEDEQDALPPKVQLDLLERGSLPGLVDAHRPSDERQDRVGVAHRCQVDEEDAVVESVDLLRGRAKRESRLARPARSGQGQQACGFVFDSASDFRQLGVASDKGRGLRRQVVRPAVDRGERRELGRQVKVHQLE